MRYDDVRDDIRDGDVLAFRGTRLFSRLIRARTLGRVSHVGFAVWLPAWGRLAVLEAMEPGGVRLHPLRHRIESGEWVDWYETDGDQVDRLAVIRAAFPHWGKRYASPWQFLRSWGVVSRWVVDKMGRPADTNHDRFFCSEFVAHCLGAAGYAVDDPVWREPARMAPADVVELPVLRRRGKLQL